MTTNHAQVGMFGIANRRRVGFTLIELLVVIAILLTLAVTTLPAFRAIKENSRGSGAQNALRAGLGTARSLAMSEGVDVAVMFRYDVRENVCSMEFIRFETTVSDADGRRGGMQAASVFKRIQGQSLVELPEGMGIFGYGYAADFQAVVPLETAWYYDLGGNRGLLQPEEEDPWVFPRTDVRLFVDDIGDASDSDVELLETFMVRFSPEGTVVTNAEELTNTFGRARGGDAFLELESPPDIDGSNYLMWDPHIDGDEIHAEFQLRSVPYLVIADLNRIKEDTGIEKPWAITGGDLNGLVNDQDGDGEPDLRELHDWMRGNTTVVAFNRYTGEMMGEYRR